jgi:hypothetical protein
MFLERKERKMDLKNHEPNIWALVIIISWLLLILTIIIYK